MGIRYLWYIATKNRCTVGRHASVKNDIAACLSFLDCKQFTSVIIEKTSLYAPVTTMDEEATCTYIVEKYFSS